ADLRRDPVGQLRRIYEHLDLPWSDGLDQRFEEAAKAHQGNKDHVFSLEGYGLSAERIQDRFADYRDRFEACSP
ncbi:MAG: hypothetical protein KC561_19680, partial [Myxococcales bacterium]|nr:hypothetical protein [Myxococcales bacterium]